MVGEVFLVAIQAVRFVTNISGIYISNTTYLSVSFAGLGFLSFYVAAKVNLYSGRYSSVSFRYSFPNLFYFKTTKLF